MEKMASSGYPTCAGLMRRRNRINKLVKSASRRYISHVFRRSSAPRQTRVRFGACAWEHDAKPVEQRGLHLGTLCDAQANVAVACLNRKGNGAVRIDYGSAKLTAAVTNV